MAQSDGRMRFRAVLAGKAVVRPASVFDPLSARMAEELEYELGLLAGSMAALVVLGAPDLIVLTLTELAEQARRICRASCIPLLVDADHGYGNALNVRRTVQELEAAGVAALSIEDTNLPQPFGESGIRLIAVAEAVGKMRAAVDARADPKTVIAGRTNIGAVPLDEAVARCRAYAEAGIDALFLTGVKRRADLDAVAAATTLPLILGTGPAELADSDYLASRHVRIALQGHGAPLAAYAALYDAMRAQRKRTSLDDPGARELVSRLSQEAGYRDLVARYLR
jgi:oxaloacetate decarboxylase